MKITRLRALPCRGSNVYRLTTEGGDGGYEIAAMLGKDHAEMIVMAVNMHEELVQKMNLLLNFLKTEAKTTPSTLFAIDSIEVTLAKIDKEKL